MYKFETHAHTSETSPCGKVPAARLVADYAEQGYSGVVITDHFCSSVFERFYAEGQTWNDVIDRYLRGFRAAKEAAPAGFTVLLGAEIRFIDTENDFLLFGIDEDFLRGSYPLISMTQDEFGAVKKSLGDFLFFQAHPFRSMCSPLNPEYLDGVEVFNGNFRHNSRNSDALAFARENSLLGTSGSDFHQPEDLAHGGITTESPITSQAEFLSALRGEHGFITSEYIPKK